MYSVSFFFVLFGTNSVKMNVQKTALEYANGNIQQSENRIHVY